MITPFIPTPEELAESERVRARQAAYTASVTQGASAPAAADATTTPTTSHTHTQSTGGTAPLPLPPYAPAEAPYPIVNAIAPQAPAPAFYAPAQAVPGQPPQPRPPLEQFILTAEQLEALVIPPRPALLDQWLCEGDLGYIYAPRGVGKTWLAMALPGAISCRRPLGLWQAGNETPPAETPAASSPEDAPAKPEEDPAPTTEAAPETASAPAPSHIPVLYVDGEMALNQSKCRARGLDLSKVHHLHHEHLFNLSGTAVNIGEPEDRQRLTNAIIRRGYRVLILDNLSSLATGIDENKGMDYEPLAHWLLDLRRRKITVIVIHHAGRNGMMRGHSKREDACSWIIELRDARQETDPGAKFVSHFAKPSRNTGDPLPDLLWHFTTDKASGITDIKCELAQEDEYEQFIKHVIDGVSSQKDIAELMNKPKGTICKWVKRALQQGRVSGSTTRLQPPAEHTSTRSFHEKEEEEEAHEAGEEEADDLF